MITTINEFKEYSNTHNLKYYEDQYDYFHLSWDRHLINDDNKTFTFTPRTPEQPYGFETSTIEDDFTKRVSLSDSIKGCLDALPDDDDGIWYIYAIKNVNLISTKDSFKNCPIGYGKDFNLFNWIKNQPKEEYREILKHVGELHDEMDISDLPDKYRDMFYACVPDANDHNEFWSLEPITMDYLGYIDSEDVTTIYHDGIENVIPKK